MRGRAGERHRDQRADRDHQQGQPELPLAHAQLVLDLGDPRHPAAVAEAVQKKTAATPAAPGPQAPPPRPTTASPDARLTIAHKPDPFVTCPTPQRRRCSIAGEHSASPDASAQAPDSLHPCPHQVDPIPGIGRIPGPAHRRPLERRDPAERRAPSTRHGDVAGRARPACAGRASAPGRTPACRQAGESRNRAVYRKLTFEVPTSYRWSMRSGSGNPRLRFPRRRTDSQGHMDHG